MATPYTPVQNTATAHRPQTFKDVIGQETPKAALRAIAKAPATSFHSLILSGPYGTGKCVSGDTLVPTAQGIREIQTLFPGIDPLADPITPPEHIPAGLTLAPTAPIRTILGDSFLKVGYLYYSGVRPAIKVLTSSGRTLIGSSIHPVLVIDTRKGRIEYVPLSKIGTHHSIIGVVSDGDPFQFLLDKQKQERIRAMVEKGFTYENLLSLSLSEQVSLIAELIFADCIPSQSFHAYENLFLICEHHEIAMAVSAIVGMAGCLSRIEQHETSDAEQAYIVRIAPVSHQSSLNQLLLALHIKHLNEHPEGITMWDGNPSPLSLKTFYKLNLAEEFMGELPFGIPLLSGERQREAISHLSGKAESDSALKALESAFTRDGLSVPYADPVVQVWQMQPRPLYDMNIPKVHAFVANGLIVHNTTLARVFAKAVNCGKRNGDACGECVHCLTHTNPHEYDSSLIGRVDAVRALREDLRSRHVGGYRTVIFDEAQTSSREAQAALLPLVEEPPRNTFFVFIEAYLLENTECLLEAILVKEGIIHYLLRKKL